VLFPVVETGGLFSAIESRRVIAKMTQGVGL